MYCERCEAGRTVPEASGTQMFVSRMWGSQNLGDLLCAACGALLTAEGFAERLLRKHLQLARFGLVGAAGPLLDTTKGDAV